MKNGFDGLVGRPDVAEERLPELEDMSTETAKTEKQREERQNGTEYPKTVVQLQKV